MSFSIIAAGTAAEAIEQVKNASCWGDDTQFEAARDLILGQLQAWPTGENSPRVVIEANGHHGNDSCNLSIAIRPIHVPRPKSATDEAKPAADSIAPE